MPFPAHLLDRPAEILEGLGTFWSETAADSALRGLLEAKALQEERLLERANEYAASFSRQAAPLLARDPWRLIRLRQSTRSSADTTIAYGDADLYYDGTYQYGQDRGASYYVWTGPAGLAEAPVLVDRRRAPNVTWLQGLDYELAGPQIRFRRNPFADPAMPVRDIVQDGAVVDRELWLWLFRPGLDTDYLYRFFGYAVGLPLPSRAAARDALNAVYDCMCDTPVDARLWALLAAVFDAPLAVAAETVRLVATDSSALWIATDARVYRGHPAATPLVSVGATLTPGQPLTNALSIWSCRRGQAPADLAGLGLLADWLDLPGETTLWATRDSVPLVATANAGTGRTEVRFSLGQGDDAFWAEVRAREAATGVSLAKLLLGRGAGDPEPGPLELPAQVRPLEFLTAHCLRNLILLRARLDLAGPRKLSLTLLNRLRYVTPAHVLYCFLLEFELTLEATAWGLPELEQLQGMALETPAWSLDDELELEILAAENCR